MKKKLNILVLASAFAMVGLTACGPQTQASSSTDVCAVTNDVKSIAEKAWNGVATTYADWSSTGVTGDQDLTTSAKKNSEDGTTTYNFDITYSVDSTYAANLKVSSDGKKLEVTCPDSLSGGSDVQTKVKVKLTLKDCTTVAYEAEFNVLVKAVAKVKSLADLYKTDAKGNALVANKSAVSFNAYYIGMYPGQGAIFGDGDYAILAYKTTELPEGTKAGDAFAISGVLSDYSGLRELSSSGTTVTKLATAPEGLTTPTTITLTSEDARAFKFGDDNRPVDVKGATVTSVSGDGSSSNLTVNVKVGSQTFAVFMNTTYSADVIPTWKQKRLGKTSAELVKPGDTVSFTGYISAYSNVYQVVYGKVYDWTEVEHSATGPVQSQLSKGATGTISLSFKGGEIASEVTVTSSDENVVSAQVKETTKDNKVTNRYVQLTAKGVGDAKITVVSKAKIGEEEKTFTDELNINVFDAEADLEETTIEALIAKASSTTTSGVWDTSKIYKVTGILEGKTAYEKTGASYLTDHTSGKSIQIYGLSGTKNSGFFKADGKYKYTNQNDASTSLSKVYNGQEVTLHVMFEDYKGVPQIAGSVFANKNVDYTYASSINVGDNGKAVLTTTDPKKFGTTVTGTVTPNEGYMVDTVTLTTNSGTSKLPVGADGKFSYSVTCKNEIDVTFKKKPVAGDLVTVTIDGEALGVAGSYGNSSADINGTEVLGNLLYLGSNGMQMKYDKNKGPSYIANKAAFHGAIQTIVVTFNAEKYSGEYGLDAGQMTLSVGSSDLSASAASGTAITKLDDKFQYTYTAEENSNNTYFNLSHTTGNSDGKSYTTYVDSVVVTYKYAA